MFYIVSYGSLTRPDLPILICCLHKWEYTCSVLGTISLQHLSFDSFGSLQFKQNRDALKE